MTKALLAAALLLAAFAASASAAPRRSATETMADACEYVTVPQLCTNLISKSSCTTVRELALAAIKEALHSAEEAKATVTKAVGEPVADPKLKQGLDVCDEAFANTMTSLQAAVNGMEAGKAYDQVTVNLSQAMIHVSACNDIFSENPGLVSPVADGTSILKKLVSNSLSLSVAVNVQLKQ
ncbi:hypothetical protein Cni_G01270 [Canna indica]|uniref:Pectinesterase inhibitor domain-containing protein n=1 Tax=Canna indica TaxID=4628 RepID=A0AAQ3JP76_9LILI|nr:hypothetical protein Cni_G01270 [Canna indica]